MTLHYRQRGSRTNMEPTLDATMESLQGRDADHRHLRHAPGCPLFPFIWVGFLSLFVIGGILAYIYIPGAGLFATIFAGIPLADDLRRARRLPRPARPGRRTRPKSSPSSPEEIDARPIA